MKIDVEAKPSYGLAVVTLDGGQVDPDVVASGRLVRQFARHLRDRVVPALRANWL